MIVIAIFGGLVLVGAAFAMLKRLGHSSHILPPRHLEGLLAGHREWFAGGGRGWGKEHAEGVGGEESESRYRGFGLALVCPVGGLPEGGSMTPQRRRIDLVNS
jgi:hypothetical protein